MIAESKQTKPNVGESSFYIYTSLSSYVNINMYVCDIPTPY